MTIVLDAVSRHGSACATPTILKVCGPFQGECCSQQVVPELRVAHTTARHSFSDVVYFFSGVVSALLTYLITVCLEVERTAPNPT